VPSSMGARDAYRAAKRKVPLKYKLYGGHIATIEPWKVVTATGLTLGLFGLYWLYRCSSAIRRSTHEAQIHPALELGLVVLTGGIFGLFAMVRNVRRLHATSLYFRRSHEDLSDLLFWLYFFAPVTLGGTLLYAVSKVQAQMNDFSELTDERERARLLGNDSTPSLKKPIKIEPSSARRTRAV
jgi:hypothetical protein